MQFTAISGVEELTFINSCRGDGVVDQGRYLGSLLDDLFIYFFYTAEGFFFHGKVGSKIIVGNSFDNAGLGFFGEEVTFGSLQALQG